MLTLAVIGAGAAGYGIYALLRHWAEPNETVLDVVRAAIGVAAFFGAVLAGVYAYRRQRVAEGDAHRSDAEQLAGRYATAAEQLGHEKAAVRLAGVYAMARLADDWPEERQTCIDVLCAYVRMPYVPNPESPKHREGEREVRHTIIRVIRDHLWDGNGLASWRGQNLDFTGALFDGGTFAGAIFSGGRVDFSGAVFSGGGVDFSRAVFSGAVVDFLGAGFSSRVDFSHAMFSGGSVDFFGASFLDGVVNFSNATFSGGLVDFSDAEFSGSLVDFSNVPIPGGVIDFSNATFSGGSVDFSRAEFSGGVVRRHVLRRRGALPVGRRLDLSPALRLRRSPSGGATPRSAR